MLLRITGSELTHLFVGSSLLSVELLSQQYHQKGRFFAYEEVENPAIWNKNRRLKAFDTKEYRGSHL
jgi:hypothetical protein